MLFITRDFSLFIHRLVLVGSVEIPIVFKAQRMSEVRNTNSLIKFFYSENLLD